MRRIAAPVCDGKALVATLACGTCTGGIMHSRLKSKMCCFVSIQAALVPATRAHDGGNMFVTPIQRATFSAKVRVEESVIQPNEGTVQFWSERKIARDNEDRIYNEIRPLVPASVTVVSEPTIIHLYDPQNRMTAYLYPERKIYRMILLNHPLPTDTRDNYASPTAIGASLSELTRQEDLGYRTIAGVQAHGVRVTQI